MLLLASELLYKAIVLISHLIVVTGCNIMYLLNSSNRMVYNVVTLKWCLSGCHLLVVTKDL